jgi:hypothetical protein
MLLSYPDIFFNIVIVLKPYGLTEYGSLYMLRISVPIPSQPENEKVRMVVRTFVNIWVAAGKAAQNSIGMALTCLAVKTGPSLQT